MKFRICGGLDAPDWLIAECAVLGQMQGGDVRALANYCIGSMLTPSETLRRKEMVWKEMHMEQGGEEAFQGDLEQLVGHDGLGSVSDVKAVIATINYFVYNSVKYSVRSSVLSNEMMQLGLPSRSCGWIIEPLMANFDQLRQAHVQKSLRVSCLDKRDDIQWRVDCIMASRCSKGALSSSVQIALPKLDHSGPISGPVKETVAFEMDSKKFRTLHAELKAARDIMIRAVQSKDINS
mmetsp:Transcript_18809/g.30736  ORF Transcript_18809/g.30736 Transcript_18809/m.30736 type:complete len:236 (+) Transcript_18809:246-953(+)|eukprot:CAMPEP_0203785384 /NCGR_PEP_ID=MMETSP0100_2-20121128/999_1 /ASSEMBLY_ACC=CAM_ASM_000210 /TAXON_ID=96639 /ORGANISM=" , Strain NY0313808BC1" /LENGTH=235 /DNA_ID=CAMNT_0050687485 /DNA_START=246 /DNA_END=953 /DNA_ORIENTATION=-